MWSEREEGGAGDSRVGGIAVQHSGRNGPGQGEGSKMWLRREDPPRASVRSRLPLWIKVVSFRFGKATAVHQT